MMKCTKCGKRESILDGNKYRVLGGKCKPCLKEYLDDMKARGERVAAL